MLNAHDLPREVVDWMSGATGAPDLSIPEWADDRLIGEYVDDGRIVRCTILIRVVGPDYSGAYRGWVTVRKGDRLAALAGRPSDTRMVYAMVGIAPDGRIWWVALYDEADLPLGDAEPMRHEMFYRLTPQQVAPAMIAPEYDLIQPSLWALSGGEEQPVAEAAAAPPAVEKVPLETVPDGKRVRIEGVVTRHNNGGSVTLEYETGKRWAILGLTPVEVID